MDILSIVLLNNLGSSRGKSKDVAIITPLLSAKSVGGCMFAVSKDRFHFLLRHYCSRRHRHCLPVLMAKLLYCLPFFAT